LAIVVDITQVLQVHREHTDRVAMILIQGRTPGVENPTAIMGTDKIDIVMKMMTTIKSVMIVNMQDLRCAMSVMLHHRDANMIVITTMRIMANHSSKKLFKLLLTVPTTMKSTQGIQMTTGNTDLKTFEQEESNMLSQMEMQVIVRKNKGTNLGMLNNITNTGNK
jgi:hypothetical protein